MIRKAKRSDIPEMIGLGRRFHEASGIGDLIEFDEVSFYRSIRDLIDHGICLVAEDGRLLGMVGAAFHRAWFNQHEIVAQELFWWVEPEARGHVSLMLLEELEKEAGGHVLGMLCLDDLKGEAVGRLYRRRGYRPVERAFMKRVG